MLQSRKTTVSRLVWLERPIREWQSLPHSEQMWWADVVSRCGLPGSRLSSFISLSQPVRQVSLQTRKGLAVVPASKQNVPNPRFPICWSQCLRPSGSSCRHLYSVIIEACQWGAFPELILSKRDLSGIRPSPNLAACTRTMLFGTLSCQVMLSMRQRQRTWKVLSFLSRRRKKAKKTLRTFLIWTKLVSEWLNLTDKHYTQTLKVSLPLLILKTNHPYCICCKYNLIIIVLKKHIFFKIYHQVKRKAYPDLSFAASQPVLVTRNRGYGSNSVAREWRQSD